MYKAKNIDTDKALQAIEAYRIQNDHNYDRDFYALKKYYDGLKAGWILLKACLNALIMKRKRLEVTHERYRKDRKID